MGLQYMSAAQRNAIALREGCGDAVAALWTEDLQRYIFVM